MASCSSLSSPFFPPSLREKFRFRGTKKGELNFPITYLRSPESSQRPKPKHFYPHFQTIPLSTTFITPPSLVKFHKNSGNLPPTYYPSQNSSFRPIFNLSLRIDNIPPVSSRILFSKSHRSKRITLASYDTIFFEWKKASSTDTVTFNRGARRRNFVSLRRREKEEEGVEGVEGPVFLRRHLSAHRFIFVA